MSVTIEACVDSLDSALAAQEVADRLELCGELSHGGVTPSAGMISIVARRLSPDCRLHVLIRPRSGDFLYSDLEMELIRHDVLHAATAGAHGIVLGFLTRAGGVDTDRTAHFCDICTALGLNLTFHRAFDVVKDHSRALEALAVCGVQRVLSSGGETTALAGAERLASLVAQAGERLSVMAGGGVNAENAVPIVQLTGVKEIHGTFRRCVTSPAGWQYNQPVTFGPCDPGRQEDAEQGVTWQRQIADADAIQLVRQRLEELAPNMR